MTWDSLNRKFYCLLYGHDWRYYIGYKLCRRCGKKVYRGGMLA